MKQKNLHFAAKFVSVDLIWGIWWFRLKIFCGKYLNSNVLRANWTLSSNKSEMLELTNSISEELPKIGHDVQLNFDQVCHKRSKVYCVASA